MFDLRQPYTSTTIKRELYFHPRLPGEFGGKGKKSEVGEEILLASLEGGLGGKGRDSGRRSREGV